jgi:ABC-type glycerol-3-phosphate transport system substrate-binding protein
LYKVRINKEVIRNHFHYDKWKYFLGVALTIFSWSLLAAITEPETPPEKKVDIYLVGGYILEDAAAEYSSTVLADFPELLEVNIYNIAIEGEMGYAGRQKLMVMTGSQSGDIYVFPKEDFEVMAELGAFVPLDEYTDLTKHFTKEQLEEYTKTTEEDPTPRVYGLPISDVEPINNSFFQTENAVMSVMAYSKNSEKALEVMQWIIEHREQAKYDQRKHELQEQVKQQEQ